MSELAGAGLAPDDMSVLADGAAALGLPLSQSQLDDFRLYQALLLEWNQRLNLTAIRQPAAVQRRHFLDSLTCAAVTGDLNGRSMVDVGAGAGFPGLPLKICYPALSLTLVESVAKKASYLSAVIQELGLSGVEIVIDRAENVGHMAEHREAHDWAVARAVAALPTLAEYLLPLCRIGGRMLAQKGPRATAELQQAAWAIEQLGGGRSELHDIQVPGLDEQRTLVVVPKVTPTPESYPRRPGVPGKSPLLAAGG